MPGAGGEVAISFMHNHTFLFEDTMRDAQWSDSTFVGLGWGGIDGLQITFIYL